MFHEDDPISLIKHDNRTLKKIRVALVTNIPTPYRNPVYDRLGAMEDIVLHLFYSTDREPNREWDLQSHSYESTYLSERFFMVGDKYVHANVDVWGALSRFKPDVIIAGGFNPTHLIAFVYSQYMGCAYIPMTDGTLQSERVLPFIHRWLRRKVYARSKAFIAASDGGFDLYESYGVDSNRIFKSQLCANNEGFYQLYVVEKKYDLIFSGRLAEFKNPFFVLEVAHAVAVRLGRKVSVAFLGGGPLENELQQRANELHHLIDATFLGFAKQVDLPRHYQSARIMLFPTLGDVWGVVANESLAASVPVIVSPAAGCAPDLIQHGRNGYVLPLACEQWAEAVICLLTDSTLYDAMVRNARESVTPYTYNNAALGIAEAVRRALGKNIQRKSETNRYGFKKKRVLLLQRRITHYREPVFNALRTRLAEKNIELLLVYGDPTPAEKEKNDAGYLSWGNHIACRYFLNGHLCWQNIGGYLQGADLVITAQENRLLYNFILHLKRSAMKMAYWGHGRNFQAKPKHLLSEMIKKWLIKRVDWWFAYTNESANIIARYGFPQSKTTVLNNSIDTSSLADEIKSVTHEEREAMRAQLKLTSDPVGLMLGSLYSEKRIDFLIDAAYLIHEKCPRFQLLIVGDGAEQVLIEQAIENGADWIHWAGARKGRDKAVILSMADVMLNPGVFGLSILDAFVAGLPVITTENKLSSPESAYLEPQINCILTANNLKAYADAVLSYLDDRTLQTRLREGSLFSAKKYSVENMVNQFCDGILKALENEDNPNWSTDSYP